MRFAHIADAFLGTWARKPSTWVVLGSVSVIVVLAVFLTVRGTTSLTRVPASGNGAPAAVTVTRTPFSAAIPSASASATTTPATSATPSSSTGSSFPVTQPTATATTATTAAPTSPPAPTQPPAPTPTPTEPPVVAGGPFCDGGQYSPPTRILGTITIGGAAAPAGTVVTLTFDGVAGPSRATTDEGGYYVDFSAGSASCANRPGAVVRVVVNGVVLQTGITVGDNEGFVRFDIAL